ncbi:unnamed protein product [Meloidogyne enterolobii]|uniref:Uncharacterized protein n=1 Tax=Meloidogyne enterolobii TaxID=390850 RepID=A0ACB0ZN86_MELEN
MSTPIPPEFFAFNAPNDLKYSCFIGLCYTGLLCEMRNITMDPNKRQSGINSLTHNRRYIRSNFFPCYTAPLILPVPPL